MVSFVVVAVGCGRHPRVEMVEKSPMDSVWMKGDVLVIKDVEGRVGVYRVVR
jgi:hypothetical protein